jgi:hypothetical protein
VIGTTKSFRGHERTLALPHVYCTDDPREFRRLVKATLDDSLPPCGADNPALRRSVLWSETRLPSFANAAALMTESVSAAALLKLHDIRNRMRRATSVMQRR